MFLNGTHKSNLSLFQSTSTNLPDLPQSRQFSLYQTISNLNVTPLNNNNLQNMIIKYKLSYLLTKLLNMPSHHES